MKNGEMAGDQVFAGVDDALAEKIISRSKENSGAAKESSCVVKGPLYHGAPGPAAFGSAEWMAGVKRRFHKFAPVAKWAVPAVLALLVLIILFVRSRDKLR